MGRSSRNCLAAKLTEAAALYPVPSHQTRQVHTVELREADRGNNTQAEARHDFVLLSLSKDNIHANLRLHQREWLHGKRGPKRISANAVGLEEHATRQQCGKGCDA